jgi:hypothetical protein
MKPEKPLLAYFGHHKCATQWMRRIVTDVCKVIGREPLVIRGWREFRGDLAAAVPSRSSTFLCCMNADMKHLRRLCHLDNGLRGFHIVRDPRDVVVSAYYSHLYSHTPFEGLAERRARLQSATKKEGLLLELENRKHEFRSMLEWDYDQPNVLELRMEDVTTAAAEEIPRITEFLGLGAADGLTVTRLREIVAAHDFAVLAGRRPGVEDVSSHYRKGVKGDWVNHFDREHVLYFKEHYGELLIKLGYEKDDNW